jgi:hypothetical protein
VRTLVATVVILFFVRILTSAQCNDKPKIAFGGDYGFVNYMFNCPSYSFAYNGDTSKNWGVLNNHIDICQAPAKVLIYKERIEKVINNYAGSRFFSKLRFYDVDVNYPEKFKAFKDSGRSDMIHKYSRAKYFYYYRFGLNDTASYLIGIAVNKRGQIINHFSFHSKKYYKPIDGTVTYCKLLEIARRTQKNIDPIEDIRLEYDRHKKEYYWCITRKLVDPKEGVNKVYSVEINAANLNDAKAVESKAWIIF